MNAIDFPIELSSLKKGESFFENLLTLQMQGFSNVAIRTSDPNFFKEFKCNAPISIINCGNGQIEHPTQALLDLMTFLQLIKEKNVTNEIKIVFVGDIKHSRVVHSHYKLLKKFRIKFSTCGPKKWMDREDLKHYSNIQEAIAQNDFIYMLRVQNERHTDKTQPVSMDQYKKDFGLSLDKLDKILHCSENKNVKVFHPGPVNVGTELEQDVIDSSYYYGHLQVENSTFLRASLLAHQLNSQNKYYKNLSMIKKGKYYEWPAPD